MSFRVAVVVFAVLGLLAAGQGTALADATPDASEPAGRAAYKRQLQRRLTFKLTAVVDAAFIIAGFPGARQALPELWRVIRDDPELQAIASNLVGQYKPRIDYAAYAGAIAQSNGYAGLAFGVEADLAAPICRYVGGAFNGQLFNDGGQRGLAYDSRVTACLPWGPFALELGLTSQRSMRMGLAAAPTSAAGRYDSRGFQLGIRGFRWMAPRWEAVTMPTEVTFVDMEPATGDGRQNAYFTIDTAFVRYIRYGVGTAGEDRVIDAFPVIVTGQQDADGAMLSATVVGVGLVRLTGIRLADRLFFDANATLQLGSIGSTVAGVEREVSLLNGGVDVSLHWVSAPYRSLVRYRRGLLPDQEFRLLSEDRGELGLSRAAGRTTLSASTFAAYTRTVGVVAARTALPSAATYGARLDYGYAIHGPFLFSVRGEAARSYYAGVPDLVLERPTVEFRVTAGLVASAGSSGR